MAPVLYGKEAEEFIERWQQSLKEPDPSRPSEKRKKELKAFFAKQKCLH
jgi:hypothetical protein